MLVLNHPNGPKTLHSTASTPNFEEAREIAFHIAKTNKISVTIVGTEEIMFSQQNPNKNTEPKIVELVIKDLKDRAEKGLETYGTYLQPFNGRDALWDAYAEALDMCKYLRQAIEERDRKGVSSQDIIYDYDTD